MGKNAGGIQDLAKNLGRMRDFGSSLDGDPHVVEFCQRYKWESYSASEYLQNYCFYQISCYSDYGNVTRRNSLKEEYETMLETGNTSHIRRQSDRPTKMEEISSS